MKLKPLQSMLLEILLLLLLASIAGIGANWKLLANAWSGKAMVSAPSALPQSPIPLPLGLMQIKELFDRNEALIIDSRDRKTYSSGHIKGAISLPLMEAASLVPEFSERTPKTTTLVVYCNGYACEDSVELGKNLISAGYTTVYYFDGGFPAWRDAGYPTAGGTR